MKTLRIYLNRSMFMCCIVCCTTQLWTQPLVDLIQVRYTYGFRNPKAEATPHTHLWIGSDLPKVFKNEKTVLIFSPTYEQWQIDSADRQEIFPIVKSFSFPVGLKIPVHPSKWFLTFAVVPRWNGEKLFAENTFQFGGATFATFVRKPHQEFRAGVYINDEFFGLFVIPLFGTDWRIDEKNNLFGVLPGRLTFEHQWSDSWYSGVTFRSITNSYRLSNGQFLRLEDNQLSLFLDYYVVKHFCVSLEPGYGLFRKIRTGINNKDYITKINWGDGPFIKISASFRIRT